MCTTSCTACKTIAKVGAISIAVIRIGTQIYDDINAIVVKDEKTLEVDDELDKEKKAGRNEAFAKVQTISDQQVAFTINSALEQIVVKNEFKEVVKLCGKTHNPSKCLDSIHYENFKDVHLSYWNLYDYYKDNFNDAIEQLKKKHPDLTVWITKAELDIPNVNYSILHEKLIKETSDIFYKEVHRIFFGCAQKELDQIIKSNASFSNIIKNTIQKLDFLPIKSNSAFEVAIGAGIERALRSPEVQKVIQYTTLTDSKQLATTILKHIKKDKRVKEAMSTAALEIDQYDRKIKDILGKNRSYQIAFNNVMEEFDQKYDYNYLTTHYFKATGKTIATATDIIINKYFKSTTIVQQALEKIVTRELTKKLISIETNTKKRYKTNKTHNSKLGLLDYYIFGKKKSMSLSELKAEQIKELAQENYYSQKSESKTYTKLLPESMTIKYITCHISGDLMTDAVRTPSGKIGQRSAIEECINNYGRDPFTNKETTIDALTTDKETKKISKAAKEFLSNL